MSDQILDLLREVRELSNGLVADECPRRESEPFIDVWEMATRAIKTREEGWAYHSPSGDIREVTHESTQTLIQRLTDLRTRLSNKIPKKDGLYAEMHGILSGILDCRRFA